MPILVFQSQFGSASVFEKKRHISYPHAEEKSAFLEISSPLSARQVYSAKLLETNKKWL